MSLYLNEPYKKKMTINISSSVTSQGFSHFFLEDSIVTPPIERYTKGDQAYLNGQNLSMEMDQAGNIKFMVEKFEENTDSLLEVNWTNRIQMMQDNISRIILRICFKELEGIDPIYESTEEGCYFILPLEDFGFQSLEKLEDLANRIVQANLPITYTDETKSKVKIGNYNDQLSFGPKLEKTGEVAIITIGELEKIDEGLKLHFHSGNRALSEYRRHRALARNLGILLNTNDPGQIWSEVKKLKSRIDNLKEEKKELEVSLGLEEVNEFLSYKRVVSDTAYIYRVLNNVNFKLLKQVIQSIQQKKRHVQIYGIPNGADGQIIVASSTDLPLNLKLIMEEVSTKYQLKGTGNLYKVQANCPYYLMREIMEEFLLKIQSTLTKE